MSVPIVSFFNNKGGVGKTSLVYHLAWMYAERGKQVVAVDLDPQSNLSSFFLTEEKIEALWLAEDQPNTIYRCIQPLIKGIGDILSPQLEEVELNSVAVALLVGDEVPSLKTDPNRLGSLKHYRSLMPMAQDARKPIFFLKPADGIVGAHYYSVQDAYRDFEQLSESIYARLSIFNTSSD